MTDKGWICLAVLLFFIVLAFAMIALWCISSNLKRIANRLIETNDKLQSIYIAQKHTESTISEAAKGVSESINDVYESMFDNAEVTIHRNGIEEDENDDV